MAEEMDEQAGAATEKTGSAKIIARCVEFMQEVITADGDNRVQAVDDLEFISGDQWPEDIQRARALDGRPCLTINTLPTFKNQVTNDLLQNKGAIKVHPVDDGADEETAEVIQGVIRHIEYDSNADTAYSTGVNSAVAAGFGYFRLITDYCDETSFDQDILFKRIRNPLTVYFGYAEEADGSDVREVAISSKISKEVFRREYPKADMAGFDSMAGLTEYADWIDDQFVRVAEYYRIESEEADVVLLSNGESGYKDKLIELPPGVTIVKERKSSRSKVMWSKLTAVEELETAEIPCKWIPVFPVYGDEVDIQGVIKRWGLVRFAKDPVRQYNFFMTTATEEYSLRPKSPFIGAEGQFEGNEDTWAQANNRSFAYLEYKPTTIEGQLVPPPQRQQPADVPTGALAMALHASDNIKKTMGMFDAAIGARGNATSGKQELVQQRESDVGQYHYTANLNLARRHAGRCIINMMPRVLDTKRVTRMVGEDGTHSTVTVNEPNTTRKPNKEGKIKEILNDLTTGKYDVTVTTGPSYTTQREEAAEYLANVANSTKDGVTSQIVTYLSLKNSDIPGAKQAAEMIRKTLPPQVIDSEDDDGRPMVQTPEGPIPVDQAGQIIAQMGQALQGANQAIEKAKVGDVQNKARELDIKEREAGTKQYEAETARMTADADLMRAATEASTSNENLLLVAQSAAKEAVSLVGQIHLEAGHAPLPPEGGAPPLQQPAEAPVGIPA